MLVALPHPETLEKSMKDIVILYDSCCLYEIVSANYYLSFSGARVDYVGLDKRPIRTKEGFSVNVDYSIDELNVSDVRSLILPGGDKRILGTDTVKAAVRTVFADGKLVAAICSAVDVVEDAGILANVCSTHSSDEDCVCDKNVITARANAYVDFGIEVAKYLCLFADEADLKETVDFWRHFKRMQ